MPKAEIERLASGSLIYGLGAVLQKFISFFLLPVFTRILNPEDYGAAALVGLIAVGVSGFFSLGTGNSLGVIYFKDQELAKRPEKIWSNVILLLINGIVMCIVLLWLAPFLSVIMFQTERFKILLQISFLTLLITTLTDPFMAYLRMEQKAKTFIILNLVGTFCSLLISVFFVVVLGLGVTGMFAAGLMAQCILFLIVLSTVGRKLPFSIDKKWLGPLIRIGFPSVWGIFAFLIIDYSDRQMIQRMLGLDALGIYSIGYNFGMIMLICVGAFSMAWPPFFVSFISRREEAKTVFAKVLKYYLIVFGFLTLAFFGLARPVITLMVAVPFQDAFVVVGMVAAAYMLKGVYLIFLPGFYFAEKLVLQSSIEWISALANIALNFVLIPRFGIAGAAGATLGCYLVLPVSAAFLSSCFLDVEHEWAKIFRCIATIAAFSLILFLASKSIQSPLSMIALAFLILALFMLLSFFWVLTEHERQKISLRMVMRSKENKL